MLPSVGHALVTISSARVSLLGSSDDDVRLLEPYLLGMKSIWLEIKSAQFTDAGVQRLLGLGNAHLIDVRETSVTRGGWFTLQMNSQCAKVPWRPEWLDESTQADRP